MPAMSQSKPSPSKEAGDAVSAAARQTALQLLARREHSTLELHHKLMRRGVPVPLIETVLGRLIEEDLLNDARYAEVYAHSRLDKGYGPIRIQRELRERGVSESVAADILAEFDDIWMRKLAQVHHKRFGGDLPSTAVERAQRMRFLRHRGFTLEQIKNFLQDH